MVVSLFLFLEVACKKKIFLHIWNKQNNYSACNMFNLQNLKIFAVNKQLTVVFFPFKPWFIPVQISLV